MLLHRVQRFEEHFEQRQLKIARHEYKRSSCIDKNPTHPLLKKSVDLGFIDSADPVYKFELS